MLNQHIAYQQTLALAENKKYNPLLYALVDGLEYERLYQNEIIQDETILPLFIQPNNQEAAFAGPWLFNVEQLTEEWINKLITLEQKYPSVSWIITSLPFSFLFNQLESKLHLRLEDNRYALLRYYDPRVLHRLSTIFTPAQFESFTLQIDEWVYYHDNHYYSLRKGRLS